MPSTAARRWATLIDQAERSDLTNRQFAERAGVNPRTLAWWKWRLASTSRTAAHTDFIEIVEEAPVEPGSVRLQVGEQLVIEVDDKTDLELLRLVVDALC